MKPDIQSIAEVLNTKALISAIANGKTRESLNSLLQTLIESNYPLRATAHESNAHLPIPSVGPLSPSGSDFSQVPFPRFILPLDGEHRIARNMANRRRDEVITPGCLHWIRPNDWYFVRNDTSRTVLAIAFHTTFTRYVWYHRDPPPQLGKSQRASPKSGAPITMLHYHTPSPVSAELSHLISLMDQASFLSPTNGAIMRQTARALLAWSLRELNLDYRRPKQPKQRMFDEICAYVLEHLGTRLDREQVANYFDISVDHLTRIFRNNTEKGFIEYVRMERLKQAEKLLMTSQLSIKEIAVTCGFNLSAYFIKRFREHYGVPPSVWRNKHSLTGAIST